MKRIAVPRWVIVSYISTIIILVVVVLWQGKIQLVVRQIQVPVTSPDGTHDSNLDVYPVGEQMPYAYLAQSPASYSLANLPTICAQTLGHAPASTSCEYVIGLHSLQVGRFGLSIENVSIQLVRVTHLKGRSVNVWDEGLREIYHGEPLTVLYWGQVQGADLEAYLDGGGFLPLRPGEADSLVLHLFSRVAAALTFHLRVSYRVLDQSTVHTLTLGHDFEIVTARTVQPYHLNDQGRLVSGARGKFPEVGKKPWSPPLVNWT